MSVGSDGILRVWDVAKAECSEAIEAHQDRCWNMTSLNEENSLVTCGADGQVVVWGDISEEVWEEGNL